MQHDFHIEGAGFRLRPARLSDSEFILSLRTQPQLSQYLHPVSGRLEDQQAWMRTYFERPGDFYFVVERADSEEAVGTIALVDVEGPGGSAEWGRWILSPESMAALPSALLIYRLGFESLQLGRIYCNTVAENAGVVSFHDSCGVERTATLPGHFDLGGRQLDAIQHTIQRTDWPAVGTRLSAKAERLHKMLSRRSR